VSRAAADDGSGAPVAAGRHLDRLVAPLFALAAVLVAALTMEAWGPAMNDPDSMASVLYFQRLAGGEPLEVYVLTTPKPLLTGVYGVTWGLVQDWRAIVWETLLVHGLGVGMAVLLASRLGGLAAGSFIGTFMILSSPHLLEVSRANSLVWSLAGWLLAGLAVTAARPRFGIAGLALLVAGAARLETFLILAFATAAIVLLAVLEVAGRASPSATRARDAMPILIGWLALPILLLHDLLLTGNPLYWLSMPSAYTALVYPSLDPIPLGTYIANLAGRYGGDAILVILAGAGVYFLVRARRWSILIGLAALTTGVLALLASLALRGLFIDARYYEEPELALAFAAAIGIGGLLRLIATAVDGRLLSRAPRGPVVAGAMAVGAALAMVLSFPLAPLNPEIAERFDTLRRASANVERIMPAIRETLEAVETPVPEAVGGNEGYTIVDPRGVAVFVPRDLVRRVAIEADASLTRIGDNLVFRSSQPKEVLLPDQSVYHDANIDVPPASFTAFETTEPTVRGTIRLVPLQADPGAGWWWLTVEPAE
jgi:hypothetical protein